MSIILLTPTSLPPAEAHFPNCVTSTLDNDEVYVSAAQGFLFKVKGNDGHACVVGKMVTSLGTGALGLTCDDIALDHSVSPEVLYCLGNGSDLYSISRTPDATPEVLATLLGDLTLGGVSIDVINAMEISSSGVAYVTSGAPDGTASGSTGGKLMTVDLGKTVAADAGKMTLVADYTDTFRSSGDLALDEQASPDDLFWTVKCRPIDGVVMPFTCASPNNDALFRIDLESVPAAGSLVFVADLGERDIFAMEYIATGDANLCYLTMQGLIFETDLSGTRIQGAGTNFPSGSAVTFVEGTGDHVAAFGATANFVGGSLIMINTMALVVAGIETNAAWLILFMMSAVGLVAYQFTSKTNTKKIKDI